MLFLASDEDQETSETHIHTHTLMFLCVNSHSALVVLFCVMCHVGLDNPALETSFSVYIGNGAQSHITCTTRSIQTH